MAQRHDSFDQSPHGVFVQTPHGDARNSEGDLFIVGNFEVGDRSGATAGDTVYNSAILRSGEWESFYEDEDPRINGELFTCIMFKGKLYTGGAGRGGLNVLNTETEKFDIVGGGVGTGFRTVLAMTIWEGLLCFVGNFDDYDGIAHTARVCAWDGENIVSLLSNRFAPDLSLRGNVVNIANVLGNLIVTGQFSLRINDVEQGNDGEFYAKFVGGTIGSAWVPYGDEYARGTSEIATFDGEAWCGQTGEVQSESSESFAVSGSSPSIVYGTFNINGELWICGQFLDVAGTVCDSVAAYNREDGWRAIGNGGFAGLKVETIFKYKNDVYIGGDFDMAYTLGEGADIQMRHITKLDKASNTWVPTSLSTSPYSGVSSGFVHDMCESTVNP